MGTAEILARVDELLAAADEHATRHEELVAKLVAERDELRNRTERVDGLLRRLGHTATTHDARRRRDREPAEPSPTTLPARMTEWLRGRGWVHCSTMYAALGLQRGVHGGSTYVALSRLVLTGVVASRGRGVLRKCCLVADLEGAIRPSEIEGPPL